MIEKFNFYDIYGYFVPGIVLVALLWVPFGLLLGAWPDDKLASAVLGLIVAYVLGHLIQRSVDGAMPPKIRDAIGHWRYPSAVLLDTATGPFSDQLKNKIVNLCKDRFKLAISLATSGEDEDKIRGEAFLRARSVILQDGKKSYSEQFQGMYALSGGLTGALWIAALYFAGWALALLARQSWKSGILFITLMVILALGIVLAWAARAHAISFPAKKAAASATTEDQKPEPENSGWRGNQKTLKQWWNGSKIREWNFLLALLAISCCTGILLAQKAMKIAEAPKEQPAKCSSPCLAITMNQPTPTDSACISVKCAGTVPPAPPDAQARAAQYGELSGIMLALALAAAMLAIRFESAYREFSKQWASTIWRDFANFEIPAAPEASIWDILKKRFGG